MEETKIEEVKEEKIEPKKKKGKVLIIVLIIIILIIGCIVGRYFIKGKDNQNTTKNEVKEESKKETKKEPEEKEEVKEETKQEKPLSEYEHNVTADAFDNSTFDQTKILDAERKGYSYELYNKQGLISMAVTVDSQNNKGLITIDWGIYHRQLGNGYQSYSNIQNISVENFKGKVLRGYGGGLGQGVGYELAIFVMEDGTVEYVTTQQIFSALKNESGTINSSGQIPGISGVAYIRGANSNAPQSTGSGTLLAIRPDGSFFDLDFHIKPNRIGT